MRPLVVFLTLLFSLPALGQQTSAEVKAIDRVMESAMRAWQIPGAAVAVVRNDRVVYVRGYGVKETGGTDPVTADTLFQIASTSKAFTTAALAMLVDEKKLSWDDPVRQHIEYFRLSDMCADSQVTVRDLASHRTGLDRHDALWDNTPWTREEVIRRVSSLELGKPFRSTYQYQNIMYTAAGEVAASVSGMAWEELIRTRVFEPLEMKRTVISDEEWRQADHATGHRYDVRNGRISPQRQIETANLAAAGAIKSSARDMANWIRFQLQDGVFNEKQLLAPGSLEETKQPQTVIRMTERVRESNPETSLMAYGLGWVVQDYRGELLVSHSGTLNGFRTHVDLLPKRNVGFVVLTNVGRSLPVVAIRNSLADVLTRKEGRDWNAYYMMIDWKRNLRDRGEREERLSSRQLGTAPSHPLPAYAGTYENAAYGTVAISLEGERIVMRWNRLEIPLDHFHFDVFTAESFEDDVDEQVVFDTDANGQVNTLTLFGQRFTRRARAPEKGSPSVTAQSP